MNKNFKSAIQSIALVLLIFALVFGASFFSRGIFPHDEMNKSPGAGPGRIDQNTGEGFERRGDIGRRLSEIPFLEEILWIKIFISSITAFLLIYLLYNYLSVYNELHSQFSLGLIVMVLALFAYAISDNPLIALFFGFRGTGLGLFTFIPSLFSLISALALLYLSRK